MKPLSKRLWFPLGIGLVILLCIISCNVYLWISDLNCPQDYMCFGSRFANALRTNQIRTAKGMVVPEQWGRLEEWERNHNAHECDHPIWEGLDGGTEGGSSTGSAISAAVEIGQRATYGTSYHCKGYFFGVGDVVLERQASGWKIFSWGQVCEWGRDENDYCD